jgi:membrane protein YdbS with pleckstrin-like domain
MNHPQNAMRRGYVLLEAEKALINWSPHALEGYCKTVTARRMWTERILSGEPSMHCPKCGVEVVADALFCQKCGTRLDESAAAATIKSAAVTVPSSRGGVDLPEEELWVGRYSPKAMIGTWIILGVLAMAVLALTIYMWASSIAYWWVPLAIYVLIDAVVAARFFWKHISIRYRLTNHRFFHEEGILRRVVNPIDLITIKDVAFEQGIIERMFNVGKVRIMSGDTTDPELVVDGIEDVQTVTTLIDKTRRAEMMRRRVFFDASPG